MKVEVNPKITITFQRNKISPATCEFLCSKLDADDLDDCNVMFIIIIIISLRTL